MLTITQMLGAPTGSTADPIGLGETLESPTRTIADLVDRTGKLTKRPLILVGDSNEVHKSTAELHAESSAQLHRTQSQERAKESIPTLLDELSGLGFSWRDIARVVGEFVRQVFAAALRGSVRTVAPGALQAVASGHQRPPAGGQRIVGHRERSPWWRRGLRHCGSPGHSAVRNTHYLGGTFDCAI